MDLSIVIPVYNEKSNVEELHKRIIEVCSSLHKSFEVIFVDDGSDDGTFEAIDPPFNQPEWYYRVSKIEDGDSINQYNYHRDPDGWWIFAWYSNYRWKPNEVHHFFVEA